MNTRPSFGQDWPHDELEMLDACPLCGHTHTHVEVSDAQDWAFRSAPGRWAYWRCWGCEGLFLNPRPRREHIAHAYRTYYTHHAREGADRAATGLKARLRSEAWAIGWSVDVSPRLNLPRWAHPVLKPLAKRVYPGFVVAGLAALPRRGRLIDVGCGNGRYLDIAKRLGFDAMGLDPDSAAVQTVRARGLPCQLGSFDDLPRFGPFDVVLASHTLEHAHEPMAALRLLLDALAPGGTLILALPNAQSPVLRAFGMHWRGLEAPRHIALPARAWLIGQLAAWGYIAKTAEIQRDYTWAESAAIAALQGDLQPTRAESTEPDLIELIVQN